VNIILNLIAFFLRMKYHYYCLFISCWWSHYNNILKIHRGPLDIMT